MPALALNQGGAVPAASYKQGGKIPGKAQVKGDSPKNDTVNAKLSPGEIVIPRSIVNHPNAPQLAAQFVAEQLKKHHSSKKNFDVGGTAVSENPENSENEAAIQADENRLQQQYGDGSAFGSMSPNDIRQMAINDFVNHQTGMARDAKKSEADQAQQGNLQNIMLQDQGVNTSAPTADAKEPVSNNVPIQQASIQNMQLPQMGPNFDPYGMYTTSDVFNKGIGEMEAGIKGQAAGAKTLAAQEAKIYQTQLLAQQQWQKTYDANTQYYQNRIEQGEQAINNYKVDPNKLFSNMGTGQKISTAIGLLLGGIGGGLTHQANPAMQFLQSQISNDIDAQKSELGKRENLLGAYFRDLGNIHEAANMTQLQIQRQIMTQLAQAEAKYKGTNAGNNASLALGQMHAQYAQQMGQMAAQKTAMDMARNTASTGQGMQNGFQLPMWMDPAAEQRVMLSGQPYHAISKERADKLQPIADTYDNLSDVLQKAIAFNKTGGTSYPLTARQGTANDLKVKIKQFMADAANHGGQIGRVMNQYSDLANSVGAFGQTQAQATLQQAYQDLQENKKTFIRNNLTEGYMPRANISRK